MVVKAAPGSNLVERRTLGPCQLYRQLLWRHLGAVAVLDYCLDSLVVDALGHLERGLDRGKSEAEDMALV